MDDKLRSTLSVVYRHGADDSPVEEGAIPSAGQLLARILDANEAMRIKICTRMLNADAESHRCMRENHLGELEFGRQRIVQLQQIIDGLRSQVIQRVEDWAGENSIAGTALNDAVAGETVQILLRSPDASSDQDK